MREGPATMAETKIVLDQGFCVHVSVTSARSERSAVQLARNAASRHYGKPVAHYVSSGGTFGRDGTEYRYVFDHPDGRAYEISDAHAQATERLHSARDALEEAQKSGADTAASKADYIESCKAWNAQYDTCTSSGADVTTERHVPAQVDTR